MSISKHNSDYAEYEGAVYSVRGTFKNDYATDIVTVIEDDGTTREIEIVGDFGSSRLIATVDATPERIAAMRKKDAFNQAVHKRRIMRMEIAESKNTGLTARQFIETCKVLRVKSFGLSDLLKRYQAGRLRSAFKINLIEQVIEWATTDPKEREHERPLSPRQEIYFFRYL